MVSVLIATRIFGPEAFGLVAYVAITAYVVFAVAAAWTGTAVARYGREQFDATGSMRAVTWSRLELAFLPLAAVCLGVLVTKAAGGFPAGFTWGLTWLALLYGCLMIATDHVLYSLQAIGRMKLSAVAAILQQLVYILGLLVILITGVGGTPVVVSSLFVAGGTVITVAFASVVWRAAIWPPVRDTSMRHRMLRFSRPMTAACASQYTIRWVDLVVLAVLAGPVATGLYAIAYRGYTVLTELTKASSTVFTPLFVSLQAGGRGDVVDRFLRRGVPQLTLMASFGLGIAVVFVAPLVPVVFGDAFRGAAEPLTVLLFALLLAFSIQLYLPVIVLHERTRELGRLAASAAVINVAGDVLLVGVFGAGIVGPAIATTAALAVLLVGYAGLARGCTGSRAGAPVSAMLPFVPGLVTALAVDGPAALLVGPSAVLLTATVVVLLTRPFRREDASLITRLDMPVALKRLTLRTVAIASR